MHDDPTLQHDRRVLSRRDDASGDRGTRRHRSGLEHSRLERDRHGRRSGATARVHSTRHGAPGDLRRGERDRRSAIRKVRECSARHPSGIRRRGRRRSRARRPRGALPRSSGRSRREVRGESRRAAGRCGASERSRRRPAGRGRDSRRACERWPGCHGDLHSRLGSGRVCADAAGLPCRAGP